MKINFKWLTVLFCAGCPLALLAAEPSLPATPGQEFLPFTNQLRIVGLVAMISLIPFGVMMMTSFTRVSIVFQFLRQALGSTQVPSNQIIIGLSLILTGFIMHPVIKEIHADAFTPYFEGALQKLPEVKNESTTAEQVFLERAWKPLRKFLLIHTREKDLALFVDIAGIKASSATASMDSVKLIDEIPWYCIVPGFMLSELRTAFMMGFLLFLPFLIIDMVVASVLMSMGMMMLPPVMVSAPFKILLFILIDGWRLIIQQIISGYNPQLYLGAT